MEDLEMDRFDFSPLFRSTIGFDRLARLVDSATRFDTAAPAYPPYNIEATGEDSYRLTMAVAGFSRDEIDVTVEKNSLVISSKAQKEEEETQGPTYIAVLPGALSSAASALPTTSRSTAQALITACSTSTWCVRCPKRRSRARSRSAKPPLQSRWSSRKLLLNLSAAEKRNAPGKLGAFFVSQPALRDHEIDDAGHAVAGF
jgi:hypothetical protein